MIKKGSSIYIVDDDESVCRAISRILKLNGYTPHYYVSANQFFEKFNRDSNSLVICDFLMPEMSGLELLKKLKKVECSIPFIFISATTSGVDLREARQLGSAFLEKPLDSNELMRAIAKT